MKLNWKLCVVSGLAMMTVAIAPLSAQTNTQINTQTNAQTNAQRTAQTNEAIQPWQQQIQAAIAQLNLTPEQRAQFQTVRQNTRSQVAEILTEAQKVQLRTSIQSNQPWPEAIATLNLTEAQRTQLRVVFRTAREQSAAILTPEQRQQARQIFFESFMN